MNKGEIVQEDVWNVVDSYFEAKGLVFYVLHT